MKKIIENIIFNTKWLLIPFLLVLALALTVYTYFDVKEFIEYILRIRRLNKEAAMLTFVELIDITMIANLGKMIITGSYNSFVSKSHGVEGENVSSGMLKVKMATSLVGVTAIAMLQKSIDIYKVDWDTLYKLAFVHTVFLLSAIILAAVDYLHLKSTTYEHVIQENISNGISTEETISSNNGKPTGKDGRVPSVLH
jgi:uncharacterized protein (TIGR00645 family)